MNITSKKNILLLSLCWLLPIILLAQNDTILSDDLYYDGKELYYDGNYQAALEKLKLALALRRKIYGEEHVQVEKAYQRLGKVYMKLRNHAPALAALERALAIAQKIEAPDSEAVTDLYILLGNTYSQMFDPEKSNRYYEKAIAIFTEKYGPQSSEIGDMYMNQGLNSLKVRNYRNADQNFQRAFDCFQKSSKPKSKEMYRIYSNYALLFTRRGEYEQALAYTKQALEIKLLHYDSLHPSVAKYYMNLGTIYENQGNYEAALVNKKKSLAIDLKALGELHPETAGNYGELADVYARMNQLDTALVLFQKSIAIQEQTMDPTHTYVLAGYFEMASIYEDQKNYDEALKSYRLVLTRAQQRSYLPRPLMADTYRRIARVYLQQEKFSKALLTIDEGLQMIAPDFKMDPSNHYLNPSLAQIKLSTRGFNLLRAKAKILQTKFERYEQSSDLKQALQTSELAIQLIDNLKQGYQSSDAKKYLNYRTAKVYEAAVEQAFAMYRLTNDGSFLYKAFQFSEKSKASILWQTVNDAYALERSSIPTEKLKTMKALEQKISALEQESQTGDSAASLQEILKLKGEYRNLIKSLEKENPQYYELKYATTALPLKTLQAKIPTEETALLEFFCSAHKIFAFVLSKNDLQAFEIPMPADLNEKVLALRGKNIDAILLQENTIKQYLAQLTDLHELLIQPLLPALAKAQNLIVIPHGIFHFLSFESLAPKIANADFRNLNYLIKNYDLQYAWSAALWAKKSNLRPRSKYPFVGFALDFKTQAQAGLLTATNFRAKLEPLNNAIPEVEAANDYFAGKVYTNGLATKTQFLEIAPKSEIIHLATHAIANDKLPAESGLLFSTFEQDRDDFLNITEIYNLKLSSKLAVMSACNTGYGQLAEGEGVMSLGRAFLYAGCQSVIMSLWLANDQSTSTIMQDFYKYAAQGFSKHHALRKAKIAYLEKADALTAHPYFWANLVAVGDMTPLAKGHSSGWMVGLVVIFVLLGFWWRSQRKKVT